MVGNAYPNGIVLLWSFIGPKPGRFGDVVHNGEEGGEGQSVHHPAPLRRPLH